MSDLLKRAFGPAAIASGASTVATVPANTRWVLKSIVVVNTTNAAITLSLGIGGTAAANLIAAPLTVQAYDTVPLEYAMLVMEAAETLQASAGAAGLTVHASGLVQSPVPT